METMIKQNSSFDGCRKLSCIVQRYEVLDRIILDCRSGLGLKTQAELDNRSFREYRGICIAITRQGEIISAMAGNHRLSIAQYFELPRIPCCLVAVHRLALGNQMWDKVYGISKSLEP
jgi:hypothetical protein